MPSVFTQVRLQQLRAGDRVHYKGVPWAVKDFSTYADNDEEYATMEWLLAGDHQEIYLLREVNPPNKERSHNITENIENVDLNQSELQQLQIERNQTNHTLIEGTHADIKQNQKPQIRWYVSTELRLEQVLVEPSGDDLRYSLWNSRQHHGNSLEPYPQLMALGELYYFDDETQGTYQGEDGSLKRCTWDYWNSDRSLNLALEFWTNDEVHVYSTTPVSPELFSDIETNEVANTMGVTTVAQGGERAWQWVTAWSMVIVGVFLMLFGGW